MAQAKKPVVKTKKKVVPVKKVVVQPKKTEVVEVKKVEVVAKQPERVKVKSEVTVDLKELLEAGAHFGHQSRRWNPKMKPYIFTTRDGVHIFDLTLTAQKIKEAADAIADWVSQGQEIIFVGTKRQAQPIIREEALKVGAPYVATRWLGGMLTNWTEMERRIKRLNDLKAKREKGELKLYTKRERVMIDKDIAKLERFFGGIAHLTERPQALFVVDTHKEVAAVKEAKKLNLMVIGLVDTNADPYEVTIPIPINDDAVRSIKLVVNKMAEAYRQGRQIKDQGK